MSNPLSGWTIISRRDLHEMARPVPYNQSTEKRVKDARWKYYQEKAKCCNEAGRLRLLKQISKEFNVKEEVILGGF